MAKAVAKSKNEQGCSEICSEIKVIGPAQGRCRGPFCPQGAEEGAGEAGRQGRGKKAAVRKPAVRR